MAQTYDEDNDIRFVNISHDKGGGITATITLEDHPKIAQGVGLFLAMITTVELMTASILAKILAVPEPEALTILEPISSYSLRLELIENLIAVKRPENASFFTFFVTEMRWLNSERNEYAHPQYGVGRDTGKIYRGLWITDGKRTTKWEVLTIEKIADDTARARKFMATIWHRMR